MILDHLCGTNLITQTLIRERKAKEPVSQRRAYEDEAEI